VTDTTKPDFAIRGTAGLSDQDLRFLVENFPQPAASYEDMAGVFAALPNTLESILEADYCYQKIYERRGELLHISPLLLFNVLLRRLFDGTRTPLDRAVINYLANLLSLFVRTDRLHRPHHGAQSYEYFVDLATAAANAGERERFLLNAHIGNYALYLTGIFADALDYRQRYKRRPVGAREYADFGRAGFRDAAAHRLARVYQLEDIFMRLALTFDHYRERLHRLAQEYLFH
jgi:hypothetical protein